MTITHLLIGIALYFGITIVVSWFMILSQWHAPLISLFAGLIAVLTLFGPVCKYLRVLPPIPFCPKCKIRYKTFKVSQIMSCNLANQKELLVLLQCQHCAAVIGYRQSDTSIFLLDHEHGDDWAVLRMKMRFPTFFGRWIEDEKFVTTQVNCILIKQNKATNL